MMGSRDDDGAYNYPEIEIPLTQQAQQMRDVESVRERASSVVGGNRINVAQLQPRDRENSPYCFLGKSIYLVFCPSHLLAFKCGADDTVCDHRRSGIVI